MELLLLIIFILINSVVINFGSLYLKKYANTHCNEDNGEDIKDTEKNLYYCGFSCCAILSAILLLFGPPSSIILKVVLILITGSSLVFRLKKKQKIANILCGVILIPIIVCIILAGSVGFIGLFVSL